MLTYKYLAPSKLDYLRASSEAKVKIQGKPKDTRAELNARNIANWTEIKFVTIIG